MSGSGLAEYCGGGIASLSVTIRLSAAAAPSVRQGLARLAGAPLAAGGACQTFLLPAGNDIDRLLAELTAVVERANRALTDSVEPAEILETRLLAGDRHGGQPPPAELDGLAVSFDAGRSFGTGTHPSTRLAIRAMRDWAAGTAAGRVLDIGCGSGVLCLVAAGLGARRVRGIDVCPEAVAVARANVARNGLADRVRIDDTPLEQLAGLHDLIVANLTASVQLRLLPHIAGRLASAATLVLSGLQGRQADEFIDLWQCRGLALAGRYSEDGWHALRMTAS